MMSPFRRAPWLNVITEDPEKAPVREFNGLRAELEETRKALKDAEWLLSDPEVASTLRSIVEERRRGKT